jgi:hypothetical protein
MTDTMNTSIRFAAAKAAATQALLLLSCAFLLAGLTACKDASVDPPPPSGGGTTPPPGEISFQHQVLPIFTDHGCTGCHGGTSGLSVGTVSALMIGGDHGPAITPGDPDGSLLIKKLSAAPPFGSRMPLGGPYLNDATIGVIRQWIAEGAKNN